MSRSDKLSKPAAESGSRALYEFPRYYDHAYRAHTRDIAFYVAQAQRSRGPVLELGAGTGRITLPLLRAGVQVTAVDQSEPMLARARERMARLRAADRARVHLVRADLRQLKLNERFALVIAPFNLFMHLYERSAVERALEVVRRHLRPDGRFVMDVLMPDLGVLRRDPARFYRCRPVFDPSDGHRYAYAESFDYAAATQIQTVQMHFQRLDKPDVERKTPLSLRYFFPEELLALLHYNGFTVLQRYGDFAGGELGPDSESQVIVARAQAPRRAVKAKRR
jgi:SAM-dependent methyltransferase